MGVLYRAGFLPSIPRENIPFKKREIKKQQQKLQCFYKRNLGEQLHKLEAVSWFETCSYAITLQALLDLLLHYIYLLEGINSF